MKVPLLAEDTFSVDYQLTGVGWSECRVTSGIFEVTVSASYLGDALGDLALAVVELLSGSLSARCSFDEEPGEYRWVFEVTSGTLVVRILQFQELWSNALDSDGAEIFRGSCTVLEFACAVCGTMSRLLAEEGVAGYKSKWVEHDFPLAAYRKIEEALSVRSAVT